MMNLVSLGIMRDEREERVISERSGWGPIKE